MLLCSILPTALLVCGGHTAETDSERLAASAAKWSKIKEECGGNYSYKAIRSSFTGYREETIVTVKDNKVVERQLLTATPAQPGQPPVVRSEWVETGKDIGSHKAGTEPRTLDELYAVAKKVLEANVPANHSRRLGLDKQGLLQYCFIVDTRIQDDAPMTGMKPIYLTIGKKK